MYATLLIHRSAGIEVTYAMPSYSCRLFICDREHNINFLVDTGSDCSLLPATKNERRLQPSQIFTAANGTPIQVLVKIFYHLI